MNVLDIVLGILLLYGLIKGAMKGLFIELASLIAIIASIYGATHFSDYIGNYLSIYINWPSKYIKIIAFAITFIAILILVSLLGRALTKIAKFAALGILNKLLGAIFGFLKMAFIASAVIMFIGPLNRGLNIMKQETINGSILYGRVAKFAPLVLPKIMKEFNKDDLK